MAELASGAQVESTQAFRAVGPPAAPDGAQSAGRVLPMVVRAAQALGFMGAATIFDQTQSTSPPRIPRLPNLLRDLVPSGDRHRAPGRVQRHMIGRAHEFQVRDAIVPLVLISVVNDVALRNRTICGLPHKAMDQVRATIPTLQQIGIFRPSRSGGTRSRTELALDTRRRPRLATMLTGSGDLRSCRPPGLHLTECRTILLPRPTGGEFSRATETPSHGGIRECLPAAPASLHVDILARRPSFRQGKAA